MFAVYNGTIKSRFVLKLVSEKSNYRTIKIIPVYLQIFVDDNNNKSRSIKPTASHNENQTCNFVRRLIVFIHIKRGSVWTKDAGGRDGLIISRGLRRLPFLLF